MIKTEYINTLKPETELEMLIINEPDFIKGIHWGKPRPGHPEGSVLLHVVEVLANIDKIKFDNNFTPEDRELLRQIALVHDTFKYKVDSTKPKHGDNHHGFYAKEFIQDFTQNPIVLTIVQHHDDAYNAWQKGNRDNKWEKAQVRGIGLISKLLALNVPKQESTGIFFHSLPYELNLFMLFYKADGATGDKKNDDYEWFEKLVWKEGKKLYEHV